MKRRREDPLISLASFLEGVHAELRVMDEALQFLQPVNFKKVPDYLDKVCENFTFSGIIVVLCRFLKLTSYKS